MYIVFSIALDVVISAHIYQRKFEKIACFQINCDEMRSYLSTVRVELKNEVTKTVVYTLNCMKHNYTT